MVGATGGGYVLSKGVVSTATVLDGDFPGIVTRVDGDPHYNARTTRTALRLFLKDADGKRRRLSLEQQTGIPIGSGFGASAASAISGIFATAAAFKSKELKRKLACYAHLAEIQESTGVGTVSVTYKATGAGAIVRAGPPGVAKFVNVKVPSGMRLVTASLAPYDKKDALSSPRLSARINELGAQALENFQADPELDNLASTGEWFTERLGLATPAVKKLVEVAKGSGAVHASQNMIGYAVHALVDEDRAARTAAALGSLSLHPRVDIFEVGSVPAGVL